MNEPAAFPVPILAYHTISDRPGDAIAPFAVTPDALARHLDLVVAGGHVALTVAQLVDRLGGAAPLAPGTVVITFDDGFEDNLTVAAPMLLDRGLSATVFVTTGFLTGGSERPYPSPGRMLAWRDLAALEEAGMEVGSHAHTHRQLDVLTHSEAAREIRLSKHLLEDALHHPIPSLAYPHGYASRWIEHEVRRCGFRAACGVRNALSHPQDNRWRLARLTVAATTTVEQVAGWLSGTAAPVAGRHEQFRTKAWRGARRAGAVCARVSSRLGARPGGAS